MQPNPTRKPKPKGLAPMETFTPTNHPFPGREVFMRQTPLLAPSQIQAQQRPSLRELQAQANSSISRPQMCTYLRNPTPPPHRQGKGKKGGMAPDRTPPSTPPRPSARSEPPRLDRRRTTAPPRSGSPLPPHPATSPVLRDFEFGTTQPPSKRRKGAQLPCPCQCLRCGGVINNFFGAGDPDEDALEDEISRLDRMIKDTWQKIMDLDAKKRKKHVKRTPEFLKRSEDLERFLKELESKREQVQNKLFRLGASKFESV